MTGQTASRRLCLNLSTLDHADWETQLRAAAAAGFSAVGPREKHVAAYLESGHTLADARTLLEANGLRALEYNFFPDWTYALGDERADMQARFARFCATARELGCGIAVAPTSFNGRNDRVDLDMAAGNLGQMAAIADESGLTVGIEFLPWSPINTITKAWELVRRVDRANVGIVLDTFHFFEGPSSMAELAAVPVEAITIVHLDDVEAVDADIVTKCRGHRVFPGEGTYRFDEILAWLDGGGYRGYYSLEIMSAAYAERDVVDLAREAHASMERLLASPGGGTPGADTGGGG